MCSLSTHIYSHVQTYLPQKPNAYKDKSKNKREKKIQTKKKSSHRFKTENLRALLYFKILYWVNLIDAFIFVSDKHRIF